MSYGLEPSVLRKDVMSKGKPQRIPVRTHANYAMLDAVENKPKVWDIEWGRDDKVATLDGKKGHVIIRKRLVEGFATGSARLIETMNDLTTLWLSSETGKYPFAPCTANGVPMFDGLTYDLNAKRFLNARPSLQVRRSRKASKRKEFLDVSMQIKAMHKLLPREDSCKSSFSLLRKHSIHNHMLAQWLDKNGHNEVALQKEGTSFNFLNGESVSLESLMDDMEKLVSMLRFEQYWSSEQQLNVPAVDAFAGYLTGYIYLSRTRHELNAD